MAFADAVRTLANQIEERRKHVATEEATKQALILPFIALLGFDVWNPAELIPEYRAGWAKATEKVDYALQLAGRVVLFIEAKGPNEVLVNYDPQLAKYFNSTPDCKFAIITNGIQYRFFTDLQERNLLDKKPFFEFDFQDFNDADIAVLDRFRKDVFNADSLVGYAEDLVFLSALKGLFKTLLREPSDDFVRFTVKTADLVDGQVTQKVVNRFKPLVKESISAALLELVGQSLQPAAVPAPPPEPERAEDAPAEPLALPRIQTTEEELALFDLVAHLVAEYVPEPGKLKYQDTQRYFAVQYANSTGWFCRMLVQADGRKFVGLRLAEGRVRELIPDGWVVEGATWLADCRVQFQDVKSLVALQPAFIEAVKAVV